MLNSNFFVNSIILDFRWQAPLKTDPAQAAGADLRASGTLVCRFRQRSVGTSSQNCRGEQSNRQKRSGDGA